MYGLQRSSSDSVARHVSGLVKSSSLSGITSVNGLPNVANSSSVNSIKSRKTFKTKLLKFSVSPIRLGNSKSSDTFFVRDPTGKIAKLIPIDNKTTPYDPYDNNIIKEVLSGTNNEYTIIWLDDV